MNIDSDQQAIHKCYMPDEQTVVYTYIVGGVLILVWVIYVLCLKRRPKLTVTDEYYGSKSH